MSQEDLGFKADIDRTYISGLERGQRNPTVRTLRRLCLALDLRLGALLDRAERKR